MYSDFFGLNEKPFSIAPDPRYLFMSERHTEGLAHLIYGDKEGGGFIQLTGEVGTGKTTLVRSLLQQLPDTADVALILNPQLSRVEFLSAICEELGVTLPEQSDSIKALTTALNAFSLSNHGRGRRTILIVDEAQNLRVDVLEQVRLLTNLETSKEKILQVVLLGQPELRELLQRRTLRQLAQRITARYHLSPLGPKDTHLYIRHRMQVAGAQRNPFRRSAMNALYQRSQGIPRLINIIADRSLIAAFAKERVEVTAHMVHEAANEVQLGERQIKRVRWPLVWGAVAATAVAVLAVATLSDFPFPAAPAPVEAAAVIAQVVEEPKLEAAGIPDTVEDSPAVLPAPEGPQALDMAWLDDHQQSVWQGLAAAWRQPGAGFAIQAACNGDDSVGYACLRDQGNWSKIDWLGLPAILVLRGDTPSYLLLQGLDGDRLLVGTGEQLDTVSKESVEAIWLGTYLLAWPQAAGWPSDIRRGGSGPAVTTIMEMATRVADPDTGEQVVDAAFALWL